MSQNLKIWDESGTDEGECSRKGASGRRVGGAIRSLVNARSLELECARVWHDSLLVSGLTYGSEAMTGKEKERSRIRATQMDNLIRLLHIRRNARVKELYGVTKGVDEGIGEGVLRWFDHVERISWHDA